jgi:membrane protease YdiL (CAAX protease family)
VVTQSGATQVAIFAGWYGFYGGIPAFTVGLLGFVSFVSVLTERSRSIWPSVLPHGSWNGLVQSYFSSSGQVGYPL